MDELKKLLENAGVQQVNEARASDVINYVITSLEKTIKAYEDGEDVYYVIDDIEDILNTIKGTRIQD